MPVTHQWRRRGGEVIKISLAGQSFVDDAYWGMGTDSLLPDGDQVRDLSGGMEGPLRVLGFAKIHTPIGLTATVRNASQSEIDAFVVAAAEDEKDQDAEDAISLLETHLRFRKVFKALALVMLDENNILRTLHGLPERTPSQLLTAVNNRVDREN